MNDTRENLKCAFRKICTLKYQDSRKIQRFKTERNIRKCLFTFSFFPCMYLFIDIRDSGFNVVILDFFFQDFVQCVDAISTQIDFYFSNMYSIDVVLGLARISSVQVLKLFSGPIVVSLTTIFRLLKVNKIDARKKHLNKRNRN